eukprot:GEZU01002542.1.p1 GENE.GEZU01002542.1~~GEZU01002542.1.p1  ORF type:complete len:163 (+),score=27.35 GEZU01002542.1:14-502(+)
MLLNVPCLPACMCVGVLLRFYLGLHNARPRIATLGIPIFTFLANIIGSIILSITYGVALKLDVFTDSGNYRGIQDLEHELPGVLYSGIARGFCGSLTTVSTLFAELHTTVALLRNKYLYGLLTFGVTILAMFCINATFVLTENYNITQKNQFAPSSPRTCFN